MSTHNIGFYEDLTKIIFELSSNIIKYAPYFFCWDATGLVIPRSDPEWVAMLFDEHLIVLCATKYQIYL